MDAPAKATPARFNFTLATLRGVTCPAGKDRVYVYDTAQPGLAFCCTARGSTSFYAIKRQRGGAPKRVLLGGFPSLSIEQARSRARDKVNELSDGVDPIAERKAARQTEEQERRQTVTFADVFAHYLEHHAKPHKRTWREDEAKFNGDLKPLHRRPVHKITRAEITKLHTEIGARAPGQANRVLALISKVLNHAREHFDLSANVATGIRKFPEHERERVLTADELPRFFEALDREPSAMMADFFRTLLWTGQRCGNVQGMRWDQIDDTRKVWTIPGEQFKNGREHVVALNAQALEVLERRRRATGGKGYVFPSTKSGTGYVKHPWSAWKRIVKDAGLVGVRPHDLRRTMGSWMSSLGANDNTVAKILGHRSIQTTRRYSRIVAIENIDPVRAAAEAAVAAIAAAGAKGGEAKDAGGGQ